MTQIPIYFAQSMTVSAQLLIAAIGIIGAGLSAWIGVKVALAQVLTNQQNQKEDIADICKRLDRLENPFFRSKD